ncbi:hypothetical protein D3C72_1580230 [compost metagenome]
MGNRVESPGCIVEQAVNRALSDAYQAAEEVLLARLGEVTLAQLSAEFHQRMVAGGHSHKEISHDDEDGTNDITNTQNNGV